MENYLTTDRQQGSSEPRSYRILGEAGYRSYSPQEVKPATIKLGPTPAVRGTDGRCPTIPPNGTKPEIKTRAVPALSPPLWTGGGDPGPHPEATHPGSRGTTIPLKGLNTTSKMADAMCAGAGERECALAGSRATNWVSGQEPKGPEELKLLTLDTATPQATTYQPTTRNSPQANSGGGLAQATRAAEPAHTAPDLPPPETANLATDQGTPTARPTTFIGGHNSGLIQQPTVSHSAQTSVLTGAHLGKSRRGTHGQPEKQPKRYQRATQQHSRRGAARTPAPENTRSRPHGPAEPKSPGTQTNPRTLFQPG
ncbi:Hypothetical predicted protein [Pelobates cultripes]|uniref:Uncharacterized protein n=2 Tax=Pelobates cultripes TaxID=61616 RepID=A0AAD1RMN9_PELCU|nr:Hypothetical predicted protein [Pelobates cultripes]